MTHDPIGFTGRMERVCACADERRCQEIQGRELDIKSTGNLAGIGGGQMLPVIFGFVFSQSVLTMLDPETAGSDRQE
ncbi:hypothetical protein A9404_02255 [Halothiobacillus diazotrophicus]|uniref:Uncharacterized protein n=1 Tax=Halothiobacillus diazotrophicus TaxID=1860122 RepID=A0A191ZER0_9GAMM|nr:hypothetical protein A9404_02255 [Halothiobacillus diazotrophicus]